MSECWMHRENRVDVVMVGTFPPPMHGMSAINEAVCYSLIECGIGVAGVDTAAVDLSRGVMSRAGRGLKSFRGLGTLTALWRKYHPTVLYIGVSGGYGQIYDIAYICLARLLGANVILHHHSFAYINKFSIVAQFLVWASGSHAKHVVLSDGMGGALEESYGRLSWVGISNAGFLNSNASVSKERQRLLAIGFLGNISVEKGALDFIEVCKKLGEKGVEIQGVLAGPFSSQSVRERVLAEIEGLSNVCYVGPRYGEEKVAFYEQIDALLFPSQYENEAEPVTVHEALSAGIPVLAYDRGAIGEIVNEDNGCLVGRQQNYVEIATARILYWINDSGAYRTVSRGARRRFLELRSVSLERWRGVVSNLISPVGGED